MGNYCLIGINYVGVGKFYVYFTAIKNVGVREHKFNWLTVLFVVVMQFRHRIEELYMKINVNYTHMNILELST